MNYFELAKLRERLKNLPNRITVGKGGTTEYTLEFKNLYKFKIKDEEYKISDFEILEDFKLFFYDNLVHITEAHCSLKQTDYKIYKMKCGKLHSIDSSALTIYEYVDKTTKHYFIEGLFYSEKQYRNLFRKSKLERLFQ